MFNERPRFEWLGKIRKMLTNYLGAAPDQQARQKSYQHSTEPHVVPNGDSTQIGIRAEVSFAPEEIKPGCYAIEFAKEGSANQVFEANPSDKMSQLVLAQVADGWNLVNVYKLNSRTILFTGKERVYQSFKPDRMILTEDVTATFGGPNLPDLTFTRNVEDASDLVLVQAFAGSYNCFPCAPNPDTGVSGQAFSHRSLGNGISWPMIQAGVDVNFGLAVKPTILRHVRPTCRRCGEDDLPAGYDRTPKMITVTAVVNLKGLLLR